MRRRYILYCEDRILKAFSTTSQALERRKLKTRLSRGRVRPGNGLLRFFLRGKASSATKTWGWGPLWSAPGRGGQVADGGCHHGVPGQRLSWPVSHHRSSAHFPRHQSPGRNTLHPQQKGELRKNLYSKPSAMDLHSSVEGTAMNSSTKQSQIAVTTSGTTLQTVETPTRKLLAMVRK